MLMRNCNISATDRQCIKKKCIFFYFYGFTLFAVKDILYNILLLQHFICTSCEIVKNYHYHVYSWYEFIIYIYIYFMVNVIKLSRIFYKYYVHPYVLL